MGESLHTRASRYSRNSFPANMEEPFSSKTRQHLVLPRALQKRGIMHKGHSRRARKISNLVFSKGKVWIAKSTFLSWLSVTKTVRQKWKQPIRMGKHIMISDPLQNKVIPIMAVKEVYNKLLNKIRKPTYCPKNNGSSLHTTDINWSKVYVIPQKVTTGTTLRIFQVKILNNILYLNKKISKFDLNVSLLCSLCNQHPEDVPHLFCNCAKT